MHARTAAHRAGAVAAAGTRRAQEWAVLLVVAVLLITTVVTFWPSMEGLTTLWSHPDRRTYQHGYLISALALWMLYRSRRDIAAAAEHSVPALLALAAVGSLCWMIAFRAGLQVIHFLLWPMIMWAAMAGVLGLKAGRLLLAPVVYLYFAMPIWDALVPLLQKATVIANEALGSLFGVLMLIEETVVHIPEGSFEIAGGCSGLNYFIVGISVAALLGEINGDSAKRRLLLLALGGGLAIISNWVRVFIIIYAGHVSDMTHYLVQVDHYNFGWVLYAFVLGAFFLIVRRLPGSMAERVAPKASGSPERPRVMTVAAAIASVALGWLVAMTASPGSTELHTSEHLAGMWDLADERFGEWQPAAAMGDWVPVFPHADSESLMDFWRDGQRVTTYSAIYLRQAQGRELIGHDSRVQGAGSGRMATRSVRTITGTKRMQAIEAEWRSPTGSRALLWWTYRVGSRDFTSGLRAQLWYGLASLWSEPVSAIVAMRAECRPDCEQARSTLQEFAAEALPAMLTAASRTGVSLE